MRVLARASSGQRLGDHPRDLLISDRPRRPRPRRIPSPVSRSCKHPAAPLAHVSRVTSKVSGHPDNDDATYLLSCKFY